ncbi:MAG: hypothetical protein UT17_C0001G0001 [Candidatus Woesebacteria bacterium GW2011_GWB1_39_10]|uniref:Uncharacterized protein n=1 Tax=Candidatus Woesebacteria bacterium GW2011_GWB1_39_10 TaxID=1618572 RepID=A0A0G0LNJ7_9BACT|nr:MAG: hypothetical protein UT17_C0001G0001 [Candidatus Woesebacteria bacterium GW2011_GWB1_39_10]
MNCMSLKFLKPRIGNVLLTLVVISLPLLREQVQLPTGGYEIARYRPVFLLTSYLQMQDWYPFLLMIGFPDLVNFFYLFSNLSYKPEI